MGTTFTAVTVHLSDNLTCKHWLIPHEILFGHNPPSLHIPNLRTTAILDPNEYSHHLQRKLLEIRELVDANIVQSAGRQQHFHTSAKPPHLRQGQRVLLNNPTKGKLDPRWTDPWVVQLPGWFNGMKTQQLYGLKKGRKNRWYTLIESDPC